MLLRFLFRSIRHDLLYLFCGHLLSFLVEQLYILCDRHISGLDGIVILHYMSRRVSLCHDWYDGGCGDLQCRLLLCLFSVCVFQLPCWNLFGLLVIVELLQL